MHACETARSTVFSDAQGKAWESFFLGSGPSARYIFQNQIPNLDSYTRTHPGWVLNDSGYCQWQVNPPPRFRDKLPNAGRNTVSSLEASIPQPDPLATDPNVESSGMAVMVLLAIAGAVAYYYWDKRQERPQTDYNPHADLDLSLPPIARINPSKLNSNSGEEIKVIGDDDPIPDGWELVEDDGEGTRPKREGAGTSPESLAPQAGLGGGERPHAESPKVPGGTASGTAQVPPAGTEGTHRGTASGTGDIRDDLELNYRFNHCQEPLIPLVGMTLEQFKEVYPDSKGDWEVDECLASVSEMKNAEARAEFFFRKFDPANSIKLLVWWVFGLSYKGGESPYAQKWRHASEICKQFIQNWQGKPF